MLIRATGGARPLKFLIATALLCISVATAQAAGLQFIEVPADADEPVLNGAVWYPCTAAVSQLEIGLTRLEAAKDGRVAGSGLPLIVVSHGYGGNRVGHHDTAETLANAGFVVAAISHPIDSGPDMSRADTVPMFAERPRDNPNGSLTTCSVAGRTAQSSTRARSVFSASPGAAIPAWFLSGPIPISTPGWLSFLRTRRSITRLTRTLICPVHSPK